MRTGSCAEGGLGTALSLHPGLALDPYLGVQGSQSCAQLPTNKRLKIRLEEVRRGCPSGPHTSGSGGWMEKERATIRDGCSRADSVAADTQGPWQAAISLQPLWRTGSWVYRFREHMLVKYEKYD